MTLTFWVSTAWFAKVRGEKRKPEINHSPEQLWPGQTPSSFCVCELEGKMERSNIFNVAMLTRDEMDGDSFYMSRGQFCDTAQEKEQEKITWEKITRHPQILQALKAFPSWRFSSTQPHLSPPQTVRKSHLAPGLIPFGHHLLAVASWVKWTFAGVLNKKQSYRLPILHQTLTCSPEWGCTKPDGRQQGSVAARKGCASATGISQPRLGHLELPSAQAILSGI